MGSGKAMELTKEDQRLVDELLELARQAPEGRLEADQMVARLKAGDFFGGTPWMEIQSVRSFDWDPDEAAWLIGDDLEEDRVEELIEGAEPEPYELELWQEAVMNASMYAEILDVHEVTASDGTRFWITVSYDGQHQGSQVIDGQGPFLTVEALGEFLGERMAAWSDYVPVYFPSPELESIVRERIVALGGTWQPLPAAAKEN